MANYRNFETTKDVGEASVNDTASQETWDPAADKRIRLNAFSVTMTAAGVAEVYLGSRRLMTLRFPDARTYYIQLPQPGDLGATDGTMTVKNVSGGARTIASSAWGREES